MSRRQKDLFPELSDGKKYVSDVPELVAEWHPIKNENMLAEGHCQNKPPCLTTIWNVAFWACPIQYRSAISKPAQRSSNSQLCYM